MDCFVGRNELTDHKEQLCKGFEFRLIDVDTFFLIENVFVVDVHIEESFNFESSREEEENICDVDLILFKISVKIDQ